MKLDKIKFAHVVAHCVSNGMSAGEYEVEELDRRIDVDVPQSDTAYPQTSDVNMLMMLMHEGTRKIEAIKMHRKLTGWGLKESKDQVEKYWVSKGHYVPASEGATLGDILATATGVRNVK